MNVKAASSILKNNDVATNKKVLCANVILLLEQGSRKRAHKPFSFDDGSPNVMRM